MDIKTFIEEYKNMAVNKKNLESHVVRKYIPFTEKVSICKNVLNACNYKTDLITGKRVYSPNSNSEYLTLNMALLEAYTDLRFYEDPIGDMEKQGKERLEEFELLDSYSMFDIFLDAKGDMISEYDLSKFMGVFQREKEDMIAREESVTQFLNTKLDVLDLVFDQFISGFMDVFKKTISEMDLDGIDDDTKGKILQFMDKVKKGNIDE